MKHLIVTFFFVLLFFRIIEANSGDSASYQKVKEVDQRIQQNRLKPKESSPTNASAQSGALPDIYFEFEIEEMNKTSPIRLDYNKDVKRYIDLYLTERRDQMAHMLGLAEMYFPIFEDYLDRYHLPQELKYLPMVESALDPLAQSKSGAMGLWQLLLNSSKLLGLDVTSYVDERCDPYKSTDAACRYIQYLHSIYSDWQLVLGAYNGGPGEVRNAMARSDGKSSYWDLQPYMAEQTKNYVPAFIAIMYVASHASELGIVPVKPDFNYFSVDSVHITYPIAFKAINENIGIPVESLKRLNPSYRLDYIPETGKPQLLVLPADKTLQYLEWETRIYATGDKKAARRQIGDTTGLKYQPYIVGQGDFLHKIALMHNCSIEDIKQWNQLTDDKLQPGTKLILYIDSKSKADTFPTRSTLQQHTDTIFYTVKKGDTMWAIAEKFQSDAARIKHLNHIDDERKLQPGQRIIISVK
jgi:membrane-bound lytic murein transglycosylase D